MDFALAYQIAAVVSSAVLGISLIEFSKSIRNIHGKVSQATLLALVFYGLSAIMLGLMAVTSVFSAGTIAQRIWIALFFVFLIVSQVHVVTESKRVHRGIYVTAIMSVTAATAVALQTPTEVSPILGAALTIAAVCAFILAMWLTYESPSPFTGGMIILLGAFMASWFVVTQGFSGLDADIDSANLFVFLFLPSLIAASLMASMLKPWRKIVTYFITFTALVVGSSLGIAALLSQESVIELQIALFILVVTIVVLASVSPIDFFLEQSAETGAKIPMYMAVTLSSISGLVILHMVFYPMVLLLGIDQDVILSYGQWILGLIGAGAFALGGIYSVTSKRNVSYVRRGFIGFAGIMLVLAHPFIRLDSSGLNYRWVYDDLFFAILSVVIIGMAGYIQVTRRLLRVGSKRAARNFIGFAFSALSTAIVVFFSDDLPYFAVIVLFVILGIAMLSSSPRRMTSHIV